MKIIVNTNKLKSAIRATEHIVGKNIGLPILNTILFKVEHGQLICSATNLEIGIQYEVGAKIEKEGEVAVPARVVSDFIAQVGDEQVVLTVVKNTLGISSKGYKTKILGMSPDEFPIIPSVNNGVSISLDSSELKKALMQVVEAVSLSETRPELGGVYTVVSKKDITFAATDSFRLSETVINIHSDDPADCIIPRMTALEMVRLLDDTGGEVSLIIAPSQVSLRAGGFTLVSRVIDGRYPDYKKVMPSGHQARITLDRGALETSVRMGSVFSSSIFDIKLNAQKDSLGIEGQNSERGEISSVVEGVLEGQPFSISVNYRYLLDGIKVLQYKDIALEYTGEGGPIVLRGQGSDSQVYIIMPLRQ
ncbi:MAG: DNA polymerase III subunit beta [Parcubacteria group bacterium]